MKPTLCLLFLIALRAVADEMPGRDAIDRLIAALNDPEQRPAVLRAADAEAAGELGGLWAGRQPWSETTPPHLVIQRVRFVTPDVALVDISAVQHGSVTLRRGIPFFLVILKSGPDWRIAAARLVAP